MAVGLLTSKPRLDDFAVIVSVIAHCISSVGIERKEKEEPKSEPAGAVDDSCYDKFGSLCHWVPPLVVG